MADVYYQPDELTQDTLALHVDNLKPGRKPEDLLFQVLLDWGVDLALPVTEEKIEGWRVFFVADNALAACFDTGLDEDFVKILAKRAAARRFPRRRLRQRRGEDQHRADLQGPQSAHRTEDAVRMNFEIRRDDIPVTLPMKCQWKALRTHSLAFHGHRRIGVRRCLLPAVS